MNRFTEFIDEFQHICIDFGFNNSFQSQRKFAIQNSYWKNESLWKSFQVSCNELHWMNINIWGKKLAFLRKFKRKSMNTNKLLTKWITSGCVTFYSFNYHIFNVCKDLRRDTKTCVECCQF